jgi:hypothetical protein
MSTAPESLAAERFRELRKADEKVQKLGQDLAEAREVVGVLTNKKAAAARRDKEAYAAALGAGKGRPSKREEPEVGAALEDAEVRSEALKLAIDAALDERARLLKANHPAWRLKATRKLAKAKRRYDDAIAELENARDGLSDEASLLGWLDGGAGIEAASDQLGGRVGDAEGRAPLSCTAVLAELRRDGDAIAAHPVTRDDPHLHVASEHVKVGALLGSQWGGD